MPDNPRIAFIAGEYPKPSEVFILRELRELRRRGVDFVVVATRRLPDAAEAEGIDAEVLLRPPFLSLRSLAAELRFAFTHPLRYYAVLFGLYFGHWRNLRELCQALSNVPRAVAVGYELRRRGVTHVHALWASFPATLGWIMARALGMTFSFSAHARDVYVEGRMLRQKAERARRIVTCTQAAANHLKTIIGDHLARKVTVIHHGLALDELPSRDESPDRTVLAAGRLVEKKGFDVLIRASAVLAKEGRKMRCVIVGDGPRRRRLERLIRETGAPVELRGWMSHDALMHEVARSAAVVAPSVLARGGDRDGIPNILLEAMAIGVPVVASGVGGIGEAVIDGETGRMVTSCDAEALAAAIARTLDETDENSVMTERAKTLITQRFTLSGNVDALARTLTETT